MSKYNIQTDKKKVTIHCNGESMKEDITVEFTGIVAGGGETIVEATITENGTYNSFPTFNTIEINGTTEFDLIVPADAMGFPLSIKKIGALASISELQKGSFTLQTKPDGGVWEPMGNFNMSDISYDAELCGYYFQDIGFSFFYLVDSAPINTILQTSYFENNGVYMSDFFVQYMIASGFTFSGEWMQTYKMYSGEADGANPVIVNIQPKIIDTLTVTKNGTYTVPENNDGYKSVDVQIPLQEVLQIYENGTYIPDEGYEGIKKFIVGTPTPKGYITGNRYFDNDIDVLGDDFVSSIESDLAGAIVTTYYQFAGATFRGNVNFSNLNRTETRKFDAIILREGTFAGSTFDNETKLIFPTTGLTRLIIGDRCFLNCDYLYELNTGEISDYISLGKEAFCDCEYLQTVILNAPELYYDVVNHPYYLYETFKGCTNLKEVVFKNYAGVVFPPMDSFPDNDDLLIYFPDDIVESFKTSSDWADLADKIRPLSEYENKPKPYLTFSSPNTFTLKNGNNTKYWDGTLEYSTDASAWSEWNGSSVSSSTDGKLYIRGTGNTYITGATGFSNQINWVLTGNDISCSGNIETLLDYQTVANGEHPIMANSCYRDMFSGCTSLINAPELLATTLTGSCYIRMFNGCTNLTTPPKLPATTLATDCYRDMFNGCTNLTTAPELPATTLQNYCYRDMFNGCKGLTTPPKLPATTLALGCYYNMFRGCISLISIPELPATTLQDYCYYTMFSGCTNIKLSATQTGDYQTEYRIPTSGTGTTAKKPFDTMFYGTGGTFTGTPTINTTYYTSNAVV